MVGILRGWHVEQLGSPLNGIVRLSEYTTGLINSIVADSTPSYFVPLGKVD
jgi:hypothetical protein